MWCLQNRKWKLRYHTSACYYVLRKIGSNGEAVYSDILIELVRVMIFSRLDSCNSLYYGLHAVLHGMLQRIIKCTCRLIFRLSPRTPTSRIIKQLHWLPVKKCLLFKFLLFGNLLVHHPQRVPEYLSSLVSRNDKVASILATFKFRSLKLTSEKHLSAIQFRMNRTDCHLNWS